MSVEEIVDSILNYMDEIIEAIEDDSDYESECDLLADYGF